MKVLTANRLTDGVVVYLTAGSAWSHRLDQALRLEPGAAADEALARAQAQPQLLVGPYLIEADAEGPSGRDRLREAIRGSGPTVGHSLRAAL